MRKTAFIIMLVTILSKVIGFVRDLALSYFYGAGMVSDVFLLSQTIPNTLFTLLGTAVMFGFIPVYSRLIDENKEEANQFASSVMRNLLLITLVIVVIGFIFMESLVSIFASGFTPEAKEMAEYFTRILLPGLFFTSVLYILRAYLQVHEKYVVTTMLGFPYNIFLIMGIFLSSIIDLRLLPIFAFIAIASQLLLFIPDLRKLNFRFDLRAKTHPVYFKELMILVMPMMISSGFAQLAMVVDRNLATRVGLGGISALNYAGRLNGFVLSLFITSILTVLYPMLSRMKATGKKDDFKNSVSDSILMTTVFVIPVSIGCMILAKPIVDILFGRGAFDTNALRMTSEALFAYAIGMLPLGLREIFQKVLYAVEDTKSPLVITAITSIVQIALCYLLYKQWGIAGIAFATSVASIVAVILYIVMVYRKDALHFGRDQILSVIKIALSACIMALVVFFVYRTVGFLPQLLRLAISIGIGALIYIAALFILQVDEAKLWVEMLKRKRKTA